MTTNKLKLDILINCSVCKQDKPKYIKDICRSCYDKEKLRKRHENSPMIACECGCGTMIHSISLSSGKKVTRVNGHCDGRKVPDYKEIIARRKPREYKPVDKVRDQIITCKTCNQPNKKQYVTGMCEACYTRQKRWKKHINSPLKKCECKPSCNIMIHSIGPSGESVNVAYEHKIGEGHPNYKGYYYDNDGYKQVYVKGYHPYKHTGNYVAEHRLIYEQYLSIMTDEEVFLPPEVIVHHIDKNPYNNSLINLELIEGGNKEHAVEHPRNGFYTGTDPEKRVCITCGSNETERNKNTNKPKWYLNDEVTGYNCHKCYCEVLEKKKNSVR